MGPSFSEEKAEARRMISWVTRYKKALGGGDVKERTRKVTAHFDDTNIIYHALAIIGKECGWKDAYIHCILDMDTFLGGFPHNNDPAYFVKVLRPACFAFSQELHTAISQDHLRKNARKMIKTFNGEPIFCYFTMDIMISADDDICKLGGVVPDLDAAKALNRREESIETGLKRVLNITELTPELQALAAFLNTEEGRESTKEEFESLVLDWTKGRTCMHCKLRGVKFKRCGECKVVYYCSKECQVADWKIHKKICF